MTSIFLLKYDKIKISVSAQSNIQIQQSKLTKMIIILWHKMLCYTFISYNLNKFIYISLTSYHGTILQTSIDK